MATGPALAQEAGIGQTVATDVAPAEEGTDAPRPFVSPLLTLNQDALFARSALGRRIIADLERDRNALAVENRRIEQELATEEQALTEQRATTPSAEFAGLAAEFDARVQAIRTEQDRKARTLQERLQLDRQGFASRAGPVLAAIARERGAVAVLDHTVVLMSFDVIDITDEVIARLDAMIGDGRLDLGSTGAEGRLAVPDPDLRPVPRTLPDLPEPDGVNGIGTVVLPD